MSKTKLKIFVSSVDGEYVPKGGEDPQVTVGTGKGDTGSTAPENSALSTPQSDDETRSGADGNKRMWRFKKLDAVKLCGLFEKELVSLQDQFDSVQTERKPSIGTPKEIAITCSDETDLKKMEKQVKEITRKLRDCNEEEVPIESDIWMKATEYVKRCPLVGDVIHYVPGHEGYKVIVMGQDYTKVSSAVHKMKVELGILRATGWRKAGRSGGGYPNRSLDDNSVEPSCPSQDASSDYGFSYEFRLNGGFVVKVYNASITKLKVDAIVNAANDSMVHAGGVAKVIANTCGYEMNKESLNYVQTYGLVAVTENIVTTAGKLKHLCKGVIHAVGPQWRMYQRKEKCLEDLRLTVIKLMTRCDQNGWVTVAMPSISAGIFGVAKELCADMYVKAAVDYSGDRSRGYSGSLKELHIVDINVSILNMVRTSHEKWKMDPNSLDPVSLVREYERIRGKRRNNSYQGQGHHGRRQLSGSCDSYTAKSRKKEFDIDLEGTISYIGSKKLYFGNTAHLYSILDGALSVKIYKGSVAKVGNVDAIVCSIDKNLTRRGVIFDALKLEGGSTFEGEFTRMSSKALKDGIKNGDVMECDAGNLRARKVVFLVKNRLSLGHFDVQEYRTGISNVLEKCRDSGHLTVALPLSGIGGIQDNVGKLQSCCMAVLYALVEFCSKFSDPKIIEVHLVNNSDKVCAMLVKVFEDISASYSSGSNGGEPGMGEFDKRRSPADDVHQEERESGARILSSSCDDIKNDRLELEQDQHDSGYGDVEDVRGNSARCLSSIFGDYRRDRYQGGGRSDEEKGGSGRSGTGGHTSSSDEDRGGERKGRKSPDESGSGQELYPRLNLQNLSIDLDKLGKSWLSGDKVRVIGGVGSNAVGDKNKAKSNGQKKGNLKIMTA